MLDIEILPAKYGDAILLSYGPKAKPHRILIDAGLSSVAGTVLARLKELDARVDLLVVTHVDLDHIAGAVKLLRTTWFTERVGGVWFNGYPHLQQFSRLLGPIDGERLTDRILELGVPWNKGWRWPRTKPGGVDAAGGPIVVATAPKRVALPGGATAIVVSPSPQKLANLLPVWKETIRKAGLVDGARARRDPDEAPARTLLGETMEDVADHSTPGDTAEANGSSIAFVFEYKDGPATRRILFGADAHPDVLVTAFEHLRGAQPRYHLDVCKLPHHGSRYNLSRELVQLIECPRWIVSSNGAKFSHPNPEAMARIVVDGTGTPTIHGNYRNEFMAKFVTQFPPNRNGYELHMPPEDTPGVTLRL